MAPIASSVGAEEDGLATEDKLTLGIVITTLGEVDDFTRSIGLDQSAVGVHPAPDTDVVRQDPLPVRAPAEVLVTIGIGIVELLVEHLRLLTRSEVVDIYSGAVSEEGHTLAVGGEEGLEARLLALGELLLL